jgi:putative transposase
MIALPERRQLLEWIGLAVTQGARLNKACGIVGLSPRTLQRWRQTEELREDGRVNRTFTPGHKLSEAERAEVIATVNREEFKQLTPHQIVPRLAERSEYLASESTFYRILKAENLLAHRHACRAPRQVSKPKALVATGPNQLYSWDITYLATTVKGLFFYLYLFMDIFSRKIVGWQVYAEESSAYAADVIKDICQLECIDRDQVILHSDNGSPMKGATLLATLQQLGILPSLSRPSVSNDNPYSEALFKTLKYRPEYPLQPFSELGEARTWVADFVAWYNFEHRHSSIRFVTPGQRHKGQDIEILSQRKATYQAAKMANPARWSKDIRNWEWQAEVYLNPDKPNTTLSKNTTNCVH